MSTSASRLPRRIRYRRLPGAAALAVTVGFAIGPALAADEAPISSDAVAAAVRDLGSDSRATRTAAEDSLREMGPDVLELLPPVDVVESAAVRDALRRLRMDLELKAARHSLRPAPVTLKGPVTLREAAAAIERQSGNQVLVDRLPADVAGKTVEVAFEAAPFWDALEHLQREAGVSWELVNEPPAVSLVALPPDAMPMLARSASGAFLVAVESVTSKPGVLHVQFQLAAEPRLRPLFLKLSDADFEARLGDRTLELFSPAAKTELPMTSRAPASFAVLFRRPAEDAAQGVLSITAKLTVETAAAPTEVRFDNLGGSIPVVRRRGGVTVTLLRTRYLGSTPGSRRARVRLSISYDTGGPAFESHRTWIYHNEVFLQSEDGRRFPVNDGFDTTAEARGGVAVEYRFKDLPDLPPTAWELVYVAPMLLIEAPVEFQMGDIVLDSAAQETLKTP